MGVTFRSGDYVKFVRFGHRSIKDGEAAAIWNARASLGQFLKIEHRDGTTTHLVGPAHLYQNPTLHTNISVMNGHNLATEDECLVLYGSSSSPNNHGSEKKPESNGLSANRRIVYGPQFVIPREDETVHTFSWSSTESANTSSTEFQVWKTNKVELWKLALSVKTQEGLSVKVQLAVSFKVDTAEKVLDVADPIGFARLAAQSDANRGDFSIDNVSDWVGQLHTYSSYKEAMESCGFRIVKFLLVGAVLPESLAGKRSAQALETERRAKASSEMKHGMELNQLEYEKQRRQAEAQAELDKLKSRLATEVAEQTAAAETKAVQRELELENIRQQAENEENKRKNDTKLDFYRGLQEMGVDVTRVLCASASRSPARKEGEPPSIPGWTAV